MKLEKKKLNTMRNIETSPSWLFSQNKYKGIASFSPFTLTPTPLLTIS